MKNMQFSLQKDQNKTVEDSKEVGRFYLDCLGKMDQFCLHTAFTAIIFVTFTFWCVWFLFDAKKLWNPESLQSQKNKPLKNLIPSSELSTSQEFTGMNRFDSFSGLRLFIRTWEKLAII